MTIQHTYMYIHTYYIHTVSLFKNWAKKYFGSIELDPRNELKEMPNHSSFFIFAPDNR